MNASESVELSGQGWHGFAHRTRQKILGAPPAGAHIKRLPSQPHSQDPPSMHRQGAESGKAEVKVGVAHGGGFYCRASIKSAALHRLWARMYVPKLPGSFPRPAPGDRGAPNEPCAHTDRCVAARAP